VGNPPKKQHSSKVENSYILLQEFSMKKSRFTDSQILAILKQLGLLSKKGSSKWMILLYI
jgi:hypothetical protein